MKQFYKCLTTLQNELGTIIFFLLIILTKIWTYTLYIIRNNFCDVIDTVFADLVSERTLYKWQVVTRIWRTELSYVDNNLFIKVV